MPSLRFSSAISFLSLASAIVAAPLTSINTANVFERRADNICSATSTCVPFTINVAYGGLDATGAGARSSILTNGTLPGPALRLKVGECVDFKVINNLGVDTGVHFHGIQQASTPWADGVPGISQYAIKSGDSYMYRWTADEAGSYFYHAHYKGQMMDGLYGAIFITPADGETTPFSAIDASAVDKLTAANAKNEPIFISDWSKYTFDQFYAIEEAGNVDIACADSIVLNGMGSQYCLTPDQITAWSAPTIATLTGGAGYTKKACLPANTTATQGGYPQNLAAIPSDVFNVCTSSSSGKNYTFSVDPTDVYASITFINPSSFSLLKATIDNHKMYVYTYNGRYIQPQVVDQINIANGERVTVFVKLDQQVGDYQIRISNLGLNQLISGFGVLSYKGSKGISSTSVPLMNYGGIATGTIVAFNPFAAAPFVPEAVSQTSDKTYFFELQKSPTAGDAYAWTLQGNTSYNMTLDDTTPLLFKDPSTIVESDIVKKTNLGQWVDIIMQSNGPLAQPHPIHKHGNKFFMIGQASGSFNWSSVAEAYAANATNFNLVNPPYLDGFTTLAGEGTATWTVYRYKVENPGAWFLHCHVQTHLSGGMAVALLDGVDKWPSVPADAGKVCQGNGVSNSTWSPSCECPASCAGNPSKTVNSTASSSSNTATSSSTGSWSNGVWVSGSNATSAAKSSSSGSSMTGSAQIQAYTGAATSTHVSLFSVLALVIAALSL